MTTPEGGNPMRYLLLIYTAEATEPPPPELMAAEMKAYGAFTEDVRKRGLMQAGEALEPTTDRGPRSGSGTARPSTTDGPFAETKEALGGFYLVDARDLDEAIELAARIPAREAWFRSRFGPIWEQAGDLERQAATAAGATR